MLLNSPDREVKDEYEIKILGKVRTDASGREVPVLFYTVYVNEKGQKRTSGLN